MKGLHAHTLALRRERTSPGQTLDALSSSARHGRLVILCGAGLSREFPSLAPVVGPSGLLPGLMDLLLESVIAPLPPRLQAAAYALLPKMGLEQFLESVAAVAGDDALEFLTILEAPASRPNYRHLAIARLALLGCLRAVVTVNFDTFLERALEELRVPYLVPEEAEDEAATYRQSLNRQDRLPVFKLHGTLRHRASLLTTIETVGLGLPLYKVGGLRQVLAGSDVLVLGYSDNDVDVFREIERADPRGTVFWHFLEAPDPALPHLARISSFLVARQHWVLSGSLDEIFAAVFTRIDPASVSDLLARLDYPDLTELARAEARAVASWSEDLRRRAREQTLSWLSPPAAALILRRSLHDEPQPRAALRLELLELVERSAAPTPRVEIARCNQVAEEMAHRGQRTAAIRLRRRLLAQYRGDDRRQLAAPLLEETIRLVRHEFAQRWQLPWAILHSWQVRRELRRRSDLPERDRTRLRLILGARIPATLHRLAQRLFAWEIPFRGGTWSRRCLAALLRLPRCWFARMAERRYRAIAEAEFGAGFRGLAMQRVAELLLLRQEKWTPEVDALLQGARWRTRPGWLATEEENEAQSLGIPGGLRLLYLGDVQGARTHLIRTFRYYAHHHDISGRAQCLLYLAAVNLELQQPRVARILLRAMTRLRKSFH